MLAGRGRFDGYDQVEGGAAAPLSSLIASAAIAYTRAIWGIPRRLSAEFACRPLLDRVAQLAKHVELVDAGVVAVAEVDAVGVAPHRLDGDDLYGRGLARLQYV